MDKICPAIHDFLLNNFFGNNLEILCRADSMITFQLMINKIIAFNYLVVYLCHSFIFIDKCMISFPSLNIAYIKNFD